MDITLLAKPEVKYMGLHANAKDKSRDRDFEAKVKPIDSLR